MIEVTESDGRLTIATRAPPRGFELAIVVALFLVLLLWLVLGLPIVVCGVLLGVGFAYLLAFPFFTRTLIEVDGEWIGTRYVGPLPWPIPGNKFATSEVMQVYVVRKSRPSRSGVRNITWHVKVRLTDGSRRHLVTAPDAGTGLDIEAGIERFLAVEDVPMASTWFQLLFLQERTHDEIEGIGEGPPVKARTPLRSNPLLWGAVGLAVLCLAYFFVSPLLSRLVR